MRIAAVQGCTAQPLLIVLAMDTKPFNKTVLWMLAGLLLWVLTLSAWASETVVGEVEPTDSVEVLAAVPDAGRVLSVDKEPIAYKKVTTNSRMAVMRSFGVLLLLSGALLLSANYIKNKRPGWIADADGKLKISGRLRVGFRNEVLVVRSGDEELIIGVGQNGISKLHVRKVTGS